jgi:hypothetical protein
MKVYLLTITAAAVTAAQAGAELPDPLEIHRHVVKALQSVHDKFPEPLKRFTETFPLTALPREGMIVLAQADAPPGAPPPPGIGPGGFVDAEAIADWANNFANVTTRATLDGIFPRSVPRKPVIVGGKGDAKANVAMEEDLNVMMRILEKAAGGNDEKRPTAGGIELFAFGKSSAPRVFYIDGYGPMFVLNVRYPLMAPPSRDDQSRTNEPTNSEWDRAREEVYGRGRGPDVLRLNGGGGEEFDEARIEHLKTQLVEGLLNARNIRNLKGDDYVTVVVLGGSSRGGGGGGVVKRTRGLTPGQPGAGGGANVEVREFRGAPGDAGAQSTMSLRVKKSDVDKFAKEKQSADEGKSPKQVNEILDEFAKKVSVQVY